MKEKERGKEERWWEGEVTCIALYDRALTGEVTQVPANVPRTPQKVFRSAVVV